MFDWWNFLFFAEKVASGSPSLDIDRESCIRSAMSRAYYAAFMSSKEHSERILDELKSANRELYNVLQEKIRNSKTHERVIKFYQAHPDISYKQIGRLLNVMRNERVRADYRRSGIVVDENNVPINRLSQEWCDEIIMQSKKIKELLEKMT